jgi:tRNA threonylcarbamoyladenosine biosynthesis protein TsaB
MNYILNIHTTTETAIVNLCNEAEVLSTAGNSDAKQHAAFLHTAIENILKKNKILPADLKAIGVTGGPGSYTGIRVGLATAKGLAYGLQIPLIIFNTLEVMAFSVIKELDENNALYCPMIDARRMEVFTAVYNHELHEIKPPEAIVLSEKTFEDLVQKNERIFIFGSGAKKWKQLINGKDNFIFLENKTISSAALASFSSHQFDEKLFGDVAYAAPLYMKEFHSTIRN